MASVCGVSVDVKVGTTKLFVDQLCLFMNDNISDLITSNLLCNMIGDMSGYMIGRYVVYFNCFCKVVE